MNRAIKEPLKRGINNEEAISVNTLIAMYNYYNKFFNKYDVSKKNKKEYRNNDFSIFLKIYT